MMFSIAFPSCPINFWSRGSHLRLPRPSLRSLGFAWCGLARNGPETDQKYGVYEVFGAQNHGRHAENLSETL